MNNGLEKALEETWKNKDKFYEDTKGLPISEIIREIENKYKARGAVYNAEVVDSSPVPSP